MHVKNQLILLTAILSIIYLWPTNSVQAEEKTFPCTDEATLETDITTAAELTKFVCFFKTWKGTKTLHFKVALKNVSDTDQRFRVNIFLQNGKAVGGFILRKIQKGLIKPGEVADFVYPVKSMAERPAGVKLKITTMDQLKD